MSLGQTRAPCVPGMGAARLLLLLGLSLYPGSLCAEGTLAHRLLRDLFANSSSALRPVHNTEQAVTVTLQITLSQIIDMDERNQVLTTYLWIRQVWTDAFRCWNKDDYGGLDAIRIPSRFVWRPDIVLYNSVDQFSDSEGTNVVLRHDGQITWDSPAIARTSCRIDVSSFPFDGQRCPLTFGSRTHGGSELELRSGRAAGDLSNFPRHVEWEVLGMPARRNLVVYGCCADPYPDVTFTLLLQRRSSFYVYNLLLPCLMVSALAPLSFHLPAGSGEKVSLGLTLLLAFTVFQLLVAEIMPPSENLPLIGKYYIATMTMISASTALSILIMNIHHCGPEVKPVPRWAKVAILQHLARALFASEAGGNCAKGRTLGAGSPAATGHRPKGEEEASEEESSGEGREQEVRLGPGSGRGCPHHRGRLSENILFITRCFRHHRAVVIRTAEWRKVAKVMDRLFMWLFVVMVVFTSALLAAKAL
uniref:neuronal acetylcholine receptor subunit alpha-10-like n=1 Tax=Pristiophorus japonicus TaxID=55135 RepID=UPI00398EDBD5